MIRDLFYSDEWEFLNSTKKIFTIRPRIYRKKFRFILYLRKMVRIVITAAVTRASHRNRLRIISYV